ncbi:DUF4834 domain-containing protein [Dyadobacter sp. LHD-138]|uniref:DUF4834 domain-containing protein n=1 Tax=Dyadobacter sp. LHD-138 TaxID=3071413 RepID=UPI0027E115B9|nr:DUF4834 domain-containing protein [Dyadobacter sp. LHD-138]MDQ6477026.1 DUF4834 domain-containing protein [Dyadobacter sp. LHD-138]
MKILFNVLVIFFLLLAFVPVFRRFMFHLLVGRQLVKEQKRQEKAYEQKKKAGIRVDSVPPDVNQSRFRGGEYVDYEEVK